MKAGGDPARSCVIVKHPFEILRSHRRCNEEPWDVTWMKWYPIDELTCNWKPWNMDFPIVNEPLYRRSRFDSFVHDGSARESMFDQSRMAIKHDAITRRLNNPSTIFSVYSTFSPNRTSRDSGRRPMSGTGRKRKKQRRRFSEWPATSLGAGEKQKCSFSLRRCLTDDFSSFSGRKLPPSLHWSHTQRGALSKKEAQREWTHLKSRDKNTVYYFFVCRMGLVWTVHLWKILIYIHAAGVNYKRINEWIRNL